MIKRLAIKQKSVLVVVHLEMCFLKSTENPISKPIVEENSPITEINSDIDSIEESGTNQEEVEFDKKDPKYLAIKITNVVLFFLLFLINAGDAHIAGGRPASPIPVFITFLISRWLVRHFFTTKPVFRNSKFYYQIGATALIWIFVFLVKLMIGVTFLNLAT